MSRTLKETSQFKTDKKRIKRSGGYDGACECHVEPDWLLIYDKSGDLKTGNLTLIRVGSHSELF